MPSERERRLHVEHADAMNHRQHNTDKLKQTIMYYVASFIPTRMIISVCLSNALHCSIGQNINSLACRFPMSGARSPAQVWRNSNDHNSATRRPVDFMFGSVLGS